MKSGLAWMLGLSIAANIVLLGARWPGRTPTDAVGSAADGGVDPGVGPTAGATGHAEGGTSAGAGRAAASTAARSGRSLWSRLNPADLPSVVSTLRMAGVPEDDVRTIVEAMVRDRFKARLDALALGDAGQPYWKTGPESFQARNRVAESRAVWREMNDLLTELLGPVPMNPVAAFQSRQRFGPLPEARLQALERLESDYSELSSMTRSTGGPSMPWEREQRDFIDAEKRRDIEALLTPAELETYDLHASNTANTMRAQLEGFAPTEAEFRAIFALQREFDARNGALPAPMLPDANRALSETQRAQREQIRALLGDVRFADYERSTDPGYQTALQVTKRLNLSADNATTTYALSRDVQARADALWRDSSLAEAERSAALAALAADANARLTSLLTESGVAAWKRRGGAWLTMLETGGRPR